MKSGSKLLFNFIILFFVAFTQALLLLLPRSAGPVFFAVIRPLAYAVMLVFTLVFVGTQFGHFKAKKQSFTILLTGTVVYVTLLLFAALLTSFGRNPMSAGPTVFLTNLWQFVPFVIIGELLRFQLMKNAPRNHKALMAAAVTLVFSFAMLENPGGMAGADAAKWIDFVMTSVLPSLVVNFFLTYICQSGSLAGIMCFRAAYSLIPVFSPYLPDITKILFAILTYVAVIVMFFLYDRYVLGQGQKTEFKPKHKWAAYVAPAAILIVCIVLFSGILPSKPVAVASESMKGEFNIGDLVVVKKLNADEAKETLKVGDIIQFHSGNIDVIHRIVEVTVDYRGQTQYITKGDNNEKPDSSPVNPEQIIGVARYKIPLLGYPAVLLLRLTSK